MTTKDNIYVNMDYWSELQTRVITAYDAEDGTYVSLDRAIAEARLNKKVTVDYDVKTVKDRITGAENVYTTYYKKEYVRHTIKEAIVFLASYLPNKLNWLITKPKVITTVQETPKDNNVYTIFVIPSYIPWKKSVYKTHSAAKSEFFKFMYQVIRDLPKVIIWKDEENFMLIHKGKLVTEIPGETPIPGVMLTGNSLRSIHRNIALSKQDEKTVQISKKTYIKRYVLEDNVVVDKHIIKKYKIVLPLLNNPYYMGMLKLSYSKRNNHMMSMAKYFYMHYETGSCPTEKFDEVTKILDIFKYLDITLPEDLNTELDVAIFKLNYITYIKVNKNALDYIEKVKDEERAETISILSTKVFLTSTVVKDDIFEDTLRIEDKGYVMVDGKAVVPHDDVDPHQVYLEEGEASASPDSQ